MIQEEYFDILSNSKAEELAATDRPKSLILPWPQPGNPVGFLTFTTVEHWRAFVDTLDLHPIIPATVNSVYRRAQMIFLLGWWDAGMLKVAELVVLAADGLTDDKLPFSKQYGGSVLPALERKRPYRHGDRPKPQMNLADIRNSLAHGARLDGLPWSGLQELVRDLIEYSFRIYLAEHHR